MIIDHKAKYSSIYDSGVKEKDKKDLHSLLFDALTIQPFDSVEASMVEGLVMQLLDVGVPVTIKDEVIGVSLYHVTPLLCRRTLYLLQSQ